ncbi:nickel/cobalt transporter [Paraburkholderia acidisoli]|uniref:Nickel/cobalt efflux system n=1 Tax=Paraburkholderia acidisoli TaxID=2571748 RepID=A0A7Z2JK05_9BURK|nr:high frequency lysogenization protein HflD [Paraburkholderia acidisoli]QGZ65930.1 high frequency lysogenization protein HflD [Paraburkholderia acidisoli]
MLSFVRVSLWAVLALCVTVLAATVALPAHAAPAVDVFGQPLHAASAAAARDDAGASAADSGSGSAPESVAAPAPHRAMLLPEFARGWLATALIWQGRLNARIADAAQQLHRDPAPATWLTLIAVAFAYGVLHAVGPGHGKLVAGTYLGSRTTRVAQAIGLAGWSAAVQAMSAIVLVFAAAWFARAGMTNVLSNAASLDVVSYLLLCAAGLFTLYTTFTRRDCCVDPRTLKLVPEERDAAPEQPAYLGAKLRVHTRAARGTFTARQSKFAVVAQILATGFASGIRPCVGSIFVLVAAVAAHAPWVGIAATFAIAAGVAVTVSLFGLGAMGVNRFVMGRGIRLRARLQATQRAVAIVGALAIVLFGAVQTTLILTGYVQPALT